MTPAEVRKLTVLEYEAFVALMREEARELERARRSR